MANPNIGSGTAFSDIVCMSSGQLYFSNKNAAVWGPEQLPTLPHAFLRIGAKSMPYVVNTMIDSLQFINRITYEPFEPSDKRALLSKTLQVDSSGTVSYSDEKVGFVSSYSHAFGANISSFQPSTLGGAGIRDVLTSNPDTVTNALGKLDAWIANAFLFQPPPITPVQSETNSIYGGLRWLNFNSYNILDKSVPYVSGCLIIIGNPSQSYDKNYCVFELSDPKYFPYKTYRDGVCRYLTPLVRLRVFTRCFLKKADKIYTKEHMQKQFIKLISECGNCTFPSKGYVLALENTDGDSTYTTLSVYLPNLPNSYSYNNPVPISIVYVNKTDGKVNATNAQIQISSLGGPCGVANVRALDASPSSSRLELTKPIYSDVNAFLSTPFFSSYNIKYTTQSYNIANDCKNTGFRYGVVDPSRLLPYYSAPYDNTQSFNYVSSIQTVSFGQQTPLFPGMRWSTSIVANNCAGIPGTPFSGPIVSTLFPYVSTPNISSMTIVNTSEHITRFKNSLHFAVYDQTCICPSIRNGWCVSSSVPNDVVFLSDQTNITFRLSTPVQLNDSTYPGDRSTIKVKTFFKDTTGLTNNTNSLSLVSANDDFTLNTTIQTTDTTLSAYISDIYTAPDSTKFFYNVMITGIQVISRISTMVQSLQFTLENRKLVGGDDTCQNGVNTQTITNICNGDGHSEAEVTIETFEPVLPQMLSSQVYSFTTEVLNDAVTQSILYTNVCTDVVQISGLFTPSPQSRFRFDILGKNFANYYVGSNFAVGQLLKNTHISEVLDQIVPAGPLSQFISSVQVYSGPIELKTLPFPQNVTLKLSTFSVGINSNIYQDIGDIQPFYIEAALTPANPVSQVTPIRMQLSTSLYIDTVSYPVFSTFGHMNGECGLRVLSLLPRTGIFIDGGDLEDETNAVVSIGPNNIRDSVDRESGMSGSGLDVDIHSLFQLSCDYKVNVQSTIVYDNTYSLSNAIPVNACELLPGQYYNRELLYTNGMYCHAAGHDFSSFTGFKLCRPEAIYPNFTSDLIHDENNGFRYATFAYTSPIFATPATLQYIRIRIIGPNMVSRIQRRREGNYFFPIAPVPEEWMYVSLIKLHVKIFGAHQGQTLDQFESGWINGFKESCLFKFNDADFDAGGCVSVAVLPNNDVEYKVQINRRHYKNIAALVRVGIARDGARLYCESGMISFKGISVSYSDT